MKKTLLISLAVSTAVLGGLCGCASHQDQQGQQAAETEQPKPAKPAKPPKDKRPIEDRLKVGMTTDEVLEVAGKPKDKSMNSDGSQVWTYNDWEKAAFIPYYSLSGGKTHFLTVVFDTDGKVKSWSSSEHSGY